MEQKKSKYDTNPLDPEVGRRTDDVWGAARSTAERAPETEDVTSATREISRAPQAAEPREEFSPEAPTRRYDNKPNLAQPYPSVFVPPTYQPPATQAPPHGVYGGAFTGTQQPPRAAGVGASLNSPPTARTVRGLSLPENVANILPYLPFPVVGAVVGVVELFLVPRDETRTRFHAAQGLALHLVVLAVSIVTSMADNFLRGGSKVMLTIASVIFSLAAFIFFIVSMIRVWKGEPYVITPVNELTRLLNEKIEPRK